MAITPLPTPPQPGDTPAEFNTNAFAWVDAIDTFTTEANALATAVDADATAAAASAVSAASSATDATNASTAALAAANFKGNWSDLTGALNKPASVYHNNVVWMLLNNLANVTTSQPGVSADWTAISAQGGSDVQVFTISGTWTKPDGVKFVTVESIGGGGGGQSGARTASSTQGNGGYGGGGGGYATQTFIATELPATVSVVVGAGGSGGSAITTNDTTAGNYGSSGSATLFGPYLNISGGAPVAGGAFVKDGTNAGTISGWVGGAGGAGITEGYISIKAGCGGGGGGEKNSSDSGTPGASGGGTQYGVSNIGSGALGGNYSSAGSNATVARDGGGGGGSGYASTFAIGTKIIFANSLFVINSGRNSIYTSTNGTTWTIKSSPQPISNFIFDGTNFVLICSLGSGVSAVYTTTDFNSYTLKSTLPIEFNAIQYVNSKYVLTGTSIVYHSTDLMNWTATNPSGSATVYSIVYIAGVYSVSLSASPFAKYSSDLVSWTNCTVTGSPSPFGNIAFNGTNLAAFGNTSSTSTHYTSNGITWTASATTAASFAAISYQNGYFFATATGGAGTYYFSTNASNWTSVISGASGNGICNMAFGAGLYVSSNYQTSATVAHTSATHNGTAWTARTLSAINTAGGNGGNGLYGGGGGGGGASLNGSNSGAGGNGGNGYCVVYSW